MYTYKNGMYTYKMVCTRSQNGMFIHNIWYVWGTKLYVYDTKWYVYIQNSMYRRVVQTSCTYVQFLWTTRKFSEQVVYGTNTYGQLFWTTRPFLKYPGTYGTEEEYIYYYDDGWLPIFHFLH